MAPRGGMREGGGRPLKDPAGPAKMASYRLPPATIEAIRQGAARLGLSQADFIARAVQVLENAPPSPTAKVRELLSGAPLDDEPYTAPERAEVDASLAEYHQKGGISLDDLIAGETSG